MTSVVYQVKQKLETSIQTAKNTEDTTLTRHQQEVKLDLDKSKIVEVKLNRNNTDHMDDSGSESGSNELIESINSKEMKIPGSSAKVKTREKS